MVCLVEFVFPKKKRKKKHKKSCQIVLNAPVAGGGVAENGAASNGSRSSIIKLSLLLTLAMPTEFQCPFKL